MSEENVSKFAKGYLKSIALCFIEGRDDVLARKLNHQEQAKIHLFEIKKEIFFLNNNKYELEEMSSEELKEAFEKSKEYDRKFIQKITDEMKKYAKSVCEIRNGYDAFEDEDRLKLKAKTINSLMLDIKNSFKGKNNKKILLENKEKLTPDEWKKEKLRSLVEKLSSRTEKNNELKNYYSKAFKGYDRSEDVRKYNSLTSFKPNK